MMFVGATAPANWLLCNGTVYLNTDIPLLAPILNNQFNAGTSAVAGTGVAVPISISGSRWARARIRSVSQAARSTSR